MNVCEEQVRQLAQLWSADADVGSIEEINYGLCADFANAIASVVPSVEIHGIYDESDVGCVPRGCSGKFMCAVKADLIGHTAVYFDGLFYDSEAPEGVRLFEQLPVCQRSMRRYLSIRVD